VAGGIPVDRDPAERESSGGFDRNVQDSLLVTHAFVPGVAAVSVEVEATAHRVGDGRKLLQRAGRQRYPDRDRRIARIQRDKTLDRTGTHFLNFPPNGSLVPRSFGRESDTKTGEKRYQTHGPGRDSRTHDKLLVLRVSVATDIIPQRSGVRPNAGPDLVQERVQGSELLRLQACHGGFGGFAGRPIEARQ